MNRYFSDRFIPRRDGPNDSKTDKTQLFNMTKNNKNSNNNNDKSDAKDNSNNNGISNDSNDSNNNNNNNSNNNNNNNNGDNDSNNENRDNENGRNRREKQGQGTPEKEFDCRLKASLLNRDIDMSIRMNESNKNGNVMGDSIDINSRVLSFCTKAPLPGQEYNANMQAIYSVGIATANNCRNNINNGLNDNEYRIKKKIRYVASSAERILDAPDFQDNFYLNLLDWSKRNVVAIGLGNALYLWNAKSGDTKCLFECTQAQYISSVAWTHTATHLGILCFYLFIVACFSCSVFVCCSD